MSFASFPLDTLGLTPHQLAACKRADLTTAADVLLPSAVELNRKLKFHRLDGVHELVKAISKAIVPQSSTAAELLEIKDEGSSGDPTAGSLGGDWIRTGDAGLDAALGGGLRVGTLTEFTGESAAGKSHFCLSLSLAAQIPALTTHTGGAMILTSEREIATDRLVELAQHLLAAHDPERYLRLADLLDNVITNLCSDLTALDHALAYKIPHILRSRSHQAHSPLTGQRPAVDEAQTEEETRVKPIRLLVIDSITALVRGADQPYAKSSSGGLTDRSRYLCSISDKLKAIAVEYNLAVLVINQVSDVFSRIPSASIQPPPLTQTAFPSSSQSMPSQFYTDGAEPPMLYATQSRWFSGQSYVLKKEASLGIVWANAINVRVMLSRTGRRRLLNQRDLSKPKRRKRDTQSPNDTENAEDGKLDDVDILAAPIVDDVKPTLIRRFHVVFSPFAAPSTIDYVVTASGIHSLPDTYRLIDIAENKRRRKRMRQAIREANGEDGDGEGAATPREGAGDNDGNGDGTVQLPSDEFGGEVFDDDFGDLPREFWEGNFEDPEASTVTISDAVENVLSPVYPRRPV